MYTIEITYWQESADGTWLTTGRFKRLHAQDKNGIQSAVKEFLGPCVSILIVGPDDLPDGDGIVGEASLHSTEIVWNLDWLARERRGEAGKNAVRHIILQCQQPDYTIHNLGPSETCIGTAISLRYSVRDGH